MFDLKSKIDEIKKQRIKIYSILNFDLSIARSDELIQITGNYIYILIATGTSSLKLNEISEDLIDIQKFRAITAPFYRLYLSNPAGSGTSIKLAIGVQSEDFKIDDSGASILGGVITEATTNILYNITCTVAGTEYSRSMGECRKFLIKPRGGQLKVCFNNGESGTNYILLNDGQAYSEDLIHTSALNLYFQSPTAGTIVEILRWY